MTYGRGQQAFGVIIIGSQKDKLIRLAARKLHDKGVIFTFCADIYEAFGRLLRFNKDKRTLVIGRLANLAAEKGRFFTKAAFYGGVCCCLADKRLRSEHLRFLASCDTKPFIINEIDQVDEAVQRISNSQFRAHDSKVRLYDKEAILTEQEIAALLSD